MASRILPYPESVSVEGLVAWGRNLVQALNSIFAEQGSGGDSSSGAGAIVGEIRAFVGQNAPAGWVFLEGQLLTVAENPGLHRVIGDLYKQAGDAAGTFRLPDARNRVPYHEPGAVAYGGENAKAIAQANLPAVNLQVNDPGHTHTFTGLAHTHGVNDPQHAHAVNGGTPTGATQVANGTTKTIQAGGTGALNTAMAPTGVTVNPATQGGNNAVAQTGITVPLGGQGTQFDVRQAWFRARWIMKV